MGSFRSIPWIQASTKSMQSVGLISRYTLSKTLLTILIPFSVAALEVECGSFYSVEKGPTFGKVLGNQTYVLGIQFPRVINTLKAGKYLTDELQLGDSAQYPEGHFLVLRMF